MNGIAGTYDIPMLCFNTSRYDVSVTKEASGKTPVLNSYGSDWEKRHAPSNFTYPSHLAIFAGFLLSPTEPHVLRSRKWFSFLSQAGTGHIPPEGSCTFKEAAFVQSLSNIGYETICIGGISFFSKRNDIGRVFPGYFNKSYWLPTSGCIDKNSAANWVDFAVSRLEKYPADRRVFMYIDFSAIHYPNCYYIEGKEKDDKEPYAAALRCVDSQLPHLSKAFGKRPDILVVALSGHDTCYGGDGYKYHRIFHERVYTVSYRHFTLRR